MKLIIFSLFFIFFACSEQIAKFKSSFVGVAKSTQAKQLCENFDFVLEELAGNKKAVTDENEIIKGSYDELKDSYNKAILFAKKGYKTCDQYRDIYFDGKNCNVKSDSFVDDNNYWLNSDSDSDSDDSVTTIILSKSFNSISKSDVEDCDISARYWINDEGVGDDYESDGYDYEEKRITKEEFYKSCLYKEGFLNKRQVLWDSVKIGRALLFNQIRLDYCSN